MEFPANIPSRPILLIDKNNFLASYLVEHLASAATVVVLSRSKIESEKDVIYVPYLLPLPQIPDGLYQSIVFVWSEKESHLLEPLMQKAKAFLFASEDEDFGITPVEAMSVGTPVIAYKSGGVVETVIDGKTGIFFTELSEQAVIEALDKLSKAKIKPSDCIAVGKRFSSERFHKELQSFVSASSQR